MAVPEEVKNLRICVIGAGMSFYLHVLYPHLHGLRHSILENGQANINSLIGMGGLSCALALAKKGFTNIQVFESAADLGFVGAGIQLAVNMARILDQLGVWKDIEKEAVVLQDTSIRRK